MIGQLELFIVKKKNLTKIESNNNIESNNEKNKINESWSDENNGIDIINVN